MITRFFSLLQWFAGLHLRKAKLESQIMVGSERYLSHYFDPTCGEGKYTKEVPDFSSEDFDVTTLGSPIIALDVCGRKVNGELLERGQEEGGEEEADGDDEEVKEEIRCALFTFSDVQSKNVDSVKNLAMRWMREKLGWEPIWRKRGEERGQDTMVFGRRYPSFPDCVFQFELRFFVRPFQRWDLPALSSPLFSFVDPFQVKEIPVGRTAQLVGLDRFLFLNLVVKGVNRNHANEALLDKLYGGDGTWRDVYSDGGSANPYADAGAFDGSVATAKTNWRLERLVDLYCRQLRNNIPPYLGWKLESEREGKGRKLSLFWVSPFDSDDRVEVDEEVPYGRTAAFAFRKGTTSPETDTIYYMILCCQTMTVLNQAKFAMQRHSCPPTSTTAGRGEGPTDEKGLVAASREALYFSNYFPSREASLAVVGRQYTDEEEALVIFAKFAGRSVRLGEVRRFVLEETGFPFHSKPLAMMETKDGRILEVDSLGEKRRRGTFKTRPMPAHHTSDEVR